MFKRLLVVVFLVYCGFFTLAPPVLAATTSSLGVMATVPTARYIYLDSAGDILKVAGNTSDNVKPTVVSGTFSPKIAQQYQQLLDANKGKLLAGVVYYSAKYDPYQIFARWLLTNPLFVYKFV